MQVMLSFVSRGLCWSVHVLSSRGKKAENQMLQHKSGFLHTWLTTRHAKAENQMLHHQYGFVHTWLTHTWLTTRHAAPAAVQKVASCRDLLISFGFCFLAARGSFNTHRLVAYWTCFCCHLYQED